MSPLSLIKASALQVFSGIVLCFSFPVLSSAVEISYYVLEEKAHPLQIVKIRSKASGIITDIVERIFRDSSHQIRVEIFPVLRLERHLFTRQSDYWITYGSPAWKTAVGTLSNESLFLVKHVLITRKDSDLRFEKIEDLFGRKIALLFGFDYPGLNSYLYHDYERIKTKEKLDQMNPPQKDYKIKDFRPQTFSKAFNLLDAQRVDCFIEMDLRIRYNLKEMGRHPDNYNFYDFSSIIAPYNIHIRMSKPLSKIAQTEIDERIRRLKTDGTIFNILENYR